MLWRLQRSKAGCGPHLTTSSARPNERFLPTLAVLALVVHSFSHCLPHLDVLQRPNLITYLMLRLDGMAAKSSAPQRRVQCRFFRSSCSVPKFSYQYSRTAICIGFLGEERRVASRSTYKGSKHATVFSRDRKHSSTAVTPAFINVSSAAMYCSVNFSAITLTLRVCWKDEPLQTSTSSCEKPMTA